MESVGKIALPTTIMFERGTNIPTDFAMLAEGGASVSRSVGDDLRAHWSKWSPVEIEVSKKRGMSRERWVDTRRTEEIECQRRLREKTVPFSKRELGVNRAEDGNKVIFKGANGTLGGVDAMFFGRDTLELDFVLGESILEILRAFVVEDV